MAAMLEDASRVQHVDTVRVADGGEAMRDEQHRAARAQFTNPLKQVVLRSSAHGGGRLVEYLQRRPTEEGPGQSDLLPLSDRQIVAAFEDGTQHGPVLVGQATNERIGARPGRGLLDRLFVFDALEPAVTDVLADREPDWPSSWNTTATIFRTESGSISAVSAPSHRMRPADGV